MATVRKLGLGSPWARQAFTREERAEIEALLPDDTRIVVTVDGDHRLYTLRGWRGLAHVLTDKVLDPVPAAREMAKELAIEGMTVTVDAHSYIRSIEVDRG